MGARARHNRLWHTTMSGEAGYHNRGIAIGAKISNLFCSLKPSTYDEISPKLGYWIEYALTEQSMEADSLAERLSPLAWDNRGSESNLAIARFLKQFRDAPHRSKEARSFVDGLCSRVIRWFAAASAEDLVPWDGVDARKVARWGGGGFIWAASFVGHLIESGVLDQELVRRHLIKPLINHHYTDTYHVGRSFRAMAIYVLFVTARNTLLQGLLEPEDIRVCFEKLISEIPLGGVPGLDIEKLMVGCATHSDILHRNLTCLVRNFVRSTSNGWGRGTRRLSKNLEETRIQSPLKPKKLNLPSHSLQMISPPQSISISLLLSCAVSGIQPSPVVRSLPLTHPPMAESP